MMGSLTPDQLDGRSSAPTTADLTIDVEQNVLARQMIGQWLAPGWRFGCLWRDRRTALPDAGNIAVEILKCERQLIGIEAFGATPELRSLQLLDDDLKALDLAIAALDNIGDLTHQTVQQIRIGWQIFEVKPHVRFYSKMLIRRRKFAIFYAGFCNVLAGKSGSPYAFGHAPVDALARSPLLIPLVFMMTLP